jgi:uncharacterized protein
MMNILYIHGFSVTGIVSETPSEKISCLETIGKVTPLRLDYRGGYNSVLSDALGVLDNQDFDLVVGTSMGGYMASMIGKLIDVPFVSCNPAITPKTSLAKYGLSDDVLESYPDMEFGNVGLIAVDLGDEVIDPLKTIEYCEDHNKRECSVVFGGGDHRFKHMKEMIPFINQMMVTNHFT